MITTVQQLRDLLATHEQCMDWSVHHRNTYNYVAAEDANAVGAIVKCPVNEWQPDVDANQWRQVWGELDNDLKLRVEDGYLDFDGSFHRGAIVAALSATLLQLCIVIARVLGETVEIKEVV